MTSVVAQQRVRAVAQEDPLHPRDHRRPGPVAFGMLGLFIGPVAVALVLTLWREWTAEPAAAHARSR